jgi:hypothetical protein
MDDLISARYGELQNGSAQLNQQAGQRADSADEHLADNRALTSDAWSDEVGNSAMTDSQYNYGMHMEDVDLNRRTAGAIDNSGMNYMDLQQRCMQGYLR